MKVNPFQAIDFIRESHDRFLQRYDVVRRDLNQALEIRKIESEEGHYFDSQENANQWNDLSFIKLKTKVEMHIRDMLDFISPLTGSKNQNVIQKIHNTQETELGNVTLDIMKKIGDFVDTMFSTKRLKFYKNALKELGISQRPLAEIS